MTSTATSTRADGDAASARDPGRLRRGWRFLTAPRGNRLWDAVIRGTGAAGLLGFLLIALSPGAGPLVGLGVYTIWVTGPLSPFFPVGLEPMLVLFGRLYAPLLVAGVSTAAGLYVEFLNYHLYRKLLAHRLARPLYDSRTVAFLRQLFERAPFFTVWFCAWAPLPYWVVRILAAMTGYPLRRYLAASLLGRFPKLWFFAALGLYWTVPDAVLLGIVGVTTAVAAAMWIWRRRRGRRGAGRPELMGAEGSK